MLSGFTVHIVIMHRQFIYQGVFYKCHYSLEIRTSFVKRQTLSENQPVAPYIVNNCRKQDLANQFEYGILNCACPFICRSKLGSDWLIINEIGPNEKMGKSGQFIDTFLAPCKANTVSAAKRAMAMLIILTIV